MRETRFRGEGSEGRKFQEDNSTKYMRTQAALGVPPAVDDESDPMAYNLYKRRFSSLIGVLHHRLDNVRRAGREVNTAERWRGARDDGSTNSFVERQLAGAGAAIAEAGALDKRNKSKFYREGQEKVAFAEDAMEIAWNRICEFLKVEVPEEGDPLWGRRADKLIDTSRRAAKDEKKTEEEAKAASSGGRKEGGGGGAM
ncbi:hypothetical protein TOPH_05518 [Tolypocladium ophioglossoides CBS 100239]|uniref:Uncharacterized protein n=1 Tax=Tolypocladium ophioglossoides (strain CBS 100239) TaxID=1163406 RepID=A0A0L0N798_TOLOC|nr:hypothetical protein TOPH_05518 [Tolypocladium ophioglossoides CBS 100239]